MKLVLQGTSLMHGEGVISFESETLARRFLETSPTTVPVNHDADREAAVAFVRAHASELRRLGVLR